VANFYFVLLPSLITKKYIWLSIIKDYYITCIENYNTTIFFRDHREDKRKINKCLYMAYTGCMDRVCRVEGKAGLVLGEEQGRVQKEFQIQERALMRNIVMGGDEKSSVITH